MVWFPTSVGRKALGALFLASTTSLLASGDSSEAVKRCESLLRAPGKDGRLGINDGELSKGFYEAVASTCAASFRTGGGPSAGLGAARASYWLGREDEALRWADRLHGTSEEVGALGIAAGLHQDHKNYVQERAVREKILKLRLAANDHREASRAYYFLFIIAWREGHFREQLEFLRLSFEQASLAANRSQQQTALNALVAPLLDIGDLNSARRVLRASLDLAAAEKKKLTLESANFDGIIRLREGQTALAIASFKQALTLARPDSTASALRAIYVNLVEASVRAGSLADAESYLKSASAHVEPDAKTPSALYYYRALVGRSLGRHRAAKDAALEALAAAPEPDWAWQLEYELGRAHEGLGEIDAAVAAFGRAVSHVDALRRSLDSNEFKSWLLDRRREPFEALFLMHARAGRTTEAIEILERAKARTFLDAFIRGAATTRSDVGGAGLLGESTARLDELQQLLPAMTRSPNVEVGPIDTVLAALSGRNVLEYFQAGNELWLASMRGGQARLHQLSRDSASVRARVDRFLANPDDAPAATELGALLLPAAALPAPGSVLHVVADGALGRLPFAALKPRGRFVVQEYVVSYVPSLNALAAAARRAPVTRGSAVVLGDPRTDLPASARESADVAGRLGVTALVGTSATRAEFARAANAGVLHLSTHTGVGARGAWAALADGDVDAAFVVERAIRPRLAVLATCASAAKESREMWGSLGAAFLAAGSESVLASLWSVGDADARDFITRFYGEDGTTDPAGALARAQRAFVKSGKPASFWAPYVHFGSAERGRHP